MTDETIVAIYDTAERAASAVRDLEAAGVATNAISRHSGGDATRSTATSEPVHEKGFWASLFGGEDDYDETLYNRSIDSGSTVVTVRATEHHLTQVMDILERHNPVDIDERANSYGLTTRSAASTAGPLASPIAAPSIPSGRDTVSRPDSEEVIPLSEEQLNLGKRLVNRGTTRVRRFVVETPVEEAVTLHSESVSVERRPVAAGTKVTDADFTDRTIEVTETAEEAVVEKTARVKEEVVVNKEVADRVETVRDTVRREDVEVTHDGQTTGNGTAAPLPPRTRSDV